MLRDRKGEATRPLIDASVGEKRVSRSGKMSRVFIFFISFIGGIMYHNQRIDRLSTGVPQCRRAASIFRVSVYEPLWS